MRTSADIRAEIAKLETEMATMLRQEREVAFEQIQTIMASVDITLADLHHHFDKVKHRPPRSAPAIKYQHPDGRNWTGQGRMPNWLVGQDLEKFRVPPSASTAGQAAA